MHNPFKVGDIVAYKRGDDIGPHGVAMKVTQVHGACVWTDNCAFPGEPWGARDLRVAIAGIDYPAPAHTGAAVMAPVPPNSGHLPDGSSVQKHSAGPLYPCVLAIRDKRLSGPAKYDYGVISPRNAEPLWFGNSETAAQVAALIKKDIES